MSFVAVTLDISESECTNEYLKSGLQTKERLKQSSQLVGQLKQLSFFATEIFRWLQRDLNW